MDKLKVAVVVEENILPSEGGGYSYYQRMVRAIDSHQFPDDIEITYLISGVKRKTYPFTKPVIVNTRRLTHRIAITICDKLFRIVHWLSPNGSKRTLEFLSRVISKLKNTSAVSCLKKNGVELVYYLKPNDYPMDFPMIVTHWDVGHKSMYPFPEVSANGNYRKRESYYINMLNRALLILCESQAGAEELIHYYPINRNKVKILPLFGGEIVDLHVDEKVQESILEKYRLETDKFFIYPAQFWAHKNHFNLVVAFKRLLSKSGNVGIKLVLCGGDQGNMSYIKRVVSSLQLEGEVVITGYVNNDVLYAFYRNAISLVMPTYLGPTNIPLIEAAMLKCPVVCSDLKGHREMLGDTAIYFDPSKAGEIEESMGRMLVSGTRETFRKNAFEQISRSSFHLSKSLEALQTILLDIKPVRKAWGSISGILQVITYANIDIMNF